MALFSPSELSYTTLPLLSSSTLLRSDARSPLSYRDIHLTTSVADGTIGSARVRIGASGCYSEVLAGVRGEVEDVAEEEEGGGKVVVGIECAAPISSLLPPSLLLHLSTLLSTLFSPSTLPPSLLHQLSSTLPLGKSWTLYLDILLLSSSAGNIPDLVLFAARSALATVRLPKTVVVGVGVEEVAVEGISGLVKGGKAGREVNKGDFELVEGGWEEGERLEAWRELPVGVTLNLINNTPHLDPTPLEESAAQSQLVICFTSTGELCGLVQIGEGEIEVSKLGGLVREAKGLVGELRGGLNARLENA